ncbi:hypothetical protein ACEWY4_008798 [Coilia grayii]|uniref:Teneurin-4 n=1 Tax=Coilia grayii TaxID=363190 RepID=A0ABD1KC40_9TELE
MGGGVGCSHCHHRLSLADGLLAEGPAAPEHPRVLWGRGRGQGPSDRICPLSASHQCPPPHPHAPLTPPRLLQPDLARREKAPERWCSSLRPEVPGRSIVTNRTRQVLYNLQSGQRREEVRRVPPHPSPPSSARCPHDEVLRVTDATPQHAALSRAEVSTASPRQAWRGVTGASSALVRHAEPPSRRQPHSIEDCPSNCYGNGDCIAGTCHCFLGFRGPDCGRVLCSGNGQYLKGRCMCHSGWKGAECDVPTNQCIDATCSSHGTCIVGTCICNPGYKGENCEEGLAAISHRPPSGLLIPSLFDCLDPTCSGRGVCVRGECHCFAGWGGAGCESPRASCMDQCSGHGAFLADTATCSCDPNWTGHDCSTDLRSRLWRPWHVRAGTCRCDEGWTGAGCEQRACHPRCQEHGTCKDGKCECSPGWNGEHCTIAHYLDKERLLYLPSAFLQSEATSAVSPPTSSSSSSSSTPHLPNQSQGEVFHFPFPCWKTFHIFSHVKPGVRGMVKGLSGLCNGNGRCTLGNNGWYCVCQLGWRGAGCDTSMETACSDSKDNDGDGLVDCMDPDCCLQASCHTTPLCVGSPDPLDIIQETQISSGQSTLQSFYERVHFLIGRDSTHVVPGANPFESR